MTSGAPRRLGLLLASFLGALSLGVVLDMTRPVERPDSAPEWSIRFVATLLLPK